MSRVFVVVVALVSGLFAGAAHAQDPAGDAPPPPLSEPAPGYDYEAPATPVPAPAPAPDSKSKVDPKTTPPPATNSGMDPLLLGFLQCGAGYIASSVVGATIIAGPLAPAANGYVQTWVGNALGQQVAPALIPIITAYVANFAVAAVAGVTYFGFLFGGLLSLSASNGDPTIFIALAVGAVIVIIVTAVASFVAVPIAYNVVSRPREADDDHTGLPGILEVSKKPRDGVKAQLPRSPRALAMAY